MDRKMTAKQLGEQQVNSVNYVAGTDQTYIRGETLRQRFIEAAMTGLCANSNVPSSEVPSSAVRIADETLQAIIDSEK